MELTLSPAALGAITAELAIAPAHLETGGILLGRLSDDGIFVSTAGGPGPRAVHRSHYFLRDLEYAKQLAAEAWSQHCSQWIGEWHTHPNTGLAPSVFDLDTYRKHLHDAELNFEIFISIIARDTPSGIRLVAWAISPSQVERISIRF